jgi:hypothetical protein
VTPAANADNRSEHQTDDELKNPGEQRSREQRAWNKNDRTSSEPFRAPSGRHKGNNTDEHGEADDGLDGSKQSRLPLRPLHDFLPGGPWWLSLPRSTRSAASLSEADRSGAKEYCGLRGTASRPPPPLAKPGFGVDSGIEVISPLSLLWRLRKAGAHAEAEREEDAERRVLYAVAATFFLLAVYIGFEATSALINGEEPDS